MINKIVLAPMEGVIDHIMRDLLTSINDYNYCVTEFLRVVDAKLPKHLFYKVMPELYTGGKTPSGTPVRIQLLGQNPHWLAENAYLAHEFGSHGIDLNFGCPAPMVNKNMGGAALLKDPEQIYQIISTVKSALSNTGQELSVKIRLGFNDTSLLNEIISAIDLAKPQILTIHARTKKQGYKPPAHWHYINKISQLTDIELISNGEIWSKESAEKCLAISGTSNIMLGRGALALPNLHNVIKHKAKPMEWKDVCKLISIWLTKDPNNLLKQFYYPSRLKQWSRYLKLQYKEADKLFIAIKTLENKEDIIDALNTHH